jgi:hypothetical protein
MIVKLKINLKIENSKVIRAGTVYNDADGPFPDFISNNLDNPNIIHKEIIVTPVKEEIKEKLKEETKEKVQIIKKVKETKIPILIRKKK